MKRAFKLPFKRAVLPIFAILQLKNEGKSRAVGQKPQPLTCANWRTMGGFVGVILSFYFEKNGKIRFIADAGLEKSVPGSGVAHFFKKNLKNGLLKRM